MKQKIIIALISAVMSALASNVVFYACNSNPDKPGVKSEGPITEHEKQKPTNCDEFTKCYYAAQFIRGEFRKDNVFHVTAGTYCKEAEKDFKFEFPEPMKKWEISTSPRAMIGYKAGAWDVLYGGSMDLTRNYKLMSIGGGPDYLKSIRGGSYYGAHITIKKQFSSFF